MGTLPGVRRLYQVMGSYVSFRSAFSVIPGARNANDQAARSHSPPTRGRLFSEATATLRHFAVNLSMAFAVRSHLGRDILAPVWTDQGGTQHSLTIIHDITNNRRLKSGVRFGMGIPSGNKSVGIRGERNVYRTQSSLVPFFAAAGEISPGTAVSTDAQFEQFVKDAVGVGYHPLGTAAIGSVVDAELRVQGTTNVFVVDGSIILIQPGSHPSSIIYGIGEKAAAMLKASPLNDDV
ncbi:GMC oxidoreductase-domain-containing protein [Mycena olivaceomarginata]|nr:GMC oxidoreductase-domain-containing protein [Mycena olivaceomarginata]